MLEKIKLCFSKEKVNLGRQPELDMAKGFAIIFMVWVHVIEMFVDTESGVMPQIVENFLGGPFAAPIFMICMGIGIVYSKHNKTKDFLKRGLSLLLMGFVLDIFRTFLPEFLFMVSERDFSWMSDALYSLISVDILQFAGLAFLFFAIMKKLKVKDSLLLIIAVVAQIAGMLLRYKSTGNYLIDSFAGYIWGTDTNTYFPFLNWIIFPVVGIMLGKIYQHLINKNTLYSFISPIAFCTGLGYLILAYVNGFGMFGEKSSYYFMGIIDVFFVVLLAVGIFGLNYFMLQIFKGYRFSNLTRLSKNINTIYCIHWVLATFVQNMLYQFIDYEPSFWGATLIALVILLLSDALAAIWVANKKRVMICRSA